MENLWWQIALGILVGNIMLGLYRFFRSVLCKAFVKSKTWEKIVAYGESGSEKSERKSTTDRKIGFGEG